RFAERFPPHFARPGGAYPPGFRKRPELLGLAIGRHAARGWHVACALSRAAGTRGVASLPPSLPPPPRPRPPPPRRPGARRPLRPRAPCILGSRRIARRGWALQEPARASTTVMRTSDGSAVQPSGSPWGATTARTVSRLPSTRKAARPTVSSFATTRA